VREKSGRALQGNMNLSKCQERASEPGLGVFILPLPLLAVMSKMCTSRTVHDALTDCPHLNSKGKNVKSTTVRVDRWAGRTTARTPRTVRGLPVDSPPGPPELHTVLSSFEVNYEPSVVDPRTVRPEAIFLEKLCQKTLDIK
jgi:hypothetical protein